MSWNTSAIFINSRLGDAPAQCFAALGASHCEFVRSVGFDEATSAFIEGRALAVVEGWTLIFDPFMFLTLGLPEGDSHGMWPLALESRLIELSRESEIVSFLLAGASGTVGFAHFEGGRQARCFLFQEGEQIKDVGAPSPQEQRVFAQENGDEEQPVLSLVGQLALGWDKVAEAEFALFQFDES